MLAIVCGIGCGRGSAPERSLDPESAREILGEALESWKAGEAYDAPSRRAGSPIRVADEDWLVGARLLEYRIEPDDQTIGADLYCEVNLSLRDSQGRSQSRRVVYAVGTDPTPTVIRQDVP